MERIDLTFEVVIKNPDGKIIMSYEETRPRWWNMTEPRESVSILESDIWQRLALARRSWQNERYAFAVKTIVAIGRNADGITQVVEIFQEG